MALAQVRWLSAVGLSCVRKVVQQLHGFGTKARPYSLLSAVVVVHAGTRLLRCCNLQNVSGVLVPQSNLCCVAAHHGDACPRVWCDVLCLASASPVPCSSPALAQCCPRCSPATAVISPGFRQCAAVTTHFSLMMDAPQKPTP